MRKHPTEIEEMRFFGKSIPPLNRRFAQTLKCKPAANPLTGSAFVIAYYSAALL